jgi:hypothetical protein
MKELYETMQIISYNQWCETANDFFDNLHSDLEPCGL